MMEHMEKFLPLSWKAFTIQVNTKNIMAMERESIDAHSIRTETLNGLH